MIDPKDLRPFKASELQIGGTFYRLDKDGFHSCCITKEDTQGPLKVQLRNLTIQYAKEERLFVRISKPWSSFA